MKLTDVETSVLVEELKSREGVEVKTADPYEDVTVCVNGPAVVLVITDYRIRWYEYTFLMYLA